jgi:hypothetical protein
MEEKIVLNLKVKREQLPKKMINHLKWTTLKLLADLQI